MFFKKLFKPKPVPLGLLPTTGEIYGHVFENPAMGVNRDLYWNASVDFQPVLLDGEEWDCSLAFEWLTWPIRRWSDLAGMGLGKLCHPELAECSFYLFEEHHPATLRHLGLRENGPATFEADFSAIAEVDDGSGRRLFEVAARCNLTFSSIILVASNLHPEPASAHEAQAAVAEFISLEALKEPHCDQQRYVFEPIL